MTKGWLLAFDEKYAPLAEVAVRGLLRFSKYPIQIVTINNVNLPQTMKSPRVWQVPYNIGKASIRDIWRHKLDICTRTMFDTTAMLDSDVVVSPNIDELMDFVEGNTANRDYPLCPLHPFDPNNHAKTMRLLGVIRKTTPHLYGHYYYSRSAIPLFQEAIQEYGALRQHHKYEPPNSDETVICSVMWRRGVNQSLCDCDVSYERFGAFIDHPSSFDYVKEAGIVSVPHPYTLHTWHGCKNIGVASDMLDKLSHLSSDAEAALRSYKPSIVTF
jgi:hypothetical protein